MTGNLNLPTPSSFPAFPFTPPYEIQVELMRHLYSSIEEKKVTIIESPTGTVSRDLARPPPVSDES
jgi:chromosome transmission fidelity protein 1